MATTASNELLKKAFFIAGFPPKGRSNENGIVESAVLDAKEFLNCIEEEIPERPFISGGTTSDSEHILTLTWLVDGLKAAKSVSVSFLGFGKYDVLWDGLNGKQHLLENVTESELIQADIPQKWRDLERLRSQAQLNIHSSHL